MVDRHVLAQPSLEAQLECPEHAPHNLDARLDGAVRLRVILNRALGLDVDQALELPQHSGDSLFQADNGALIVRLNDHASVSEPFHVCGDQTSAIVFFVVALLWDDMRERVLACQASRGHTLDNLAGCAGGCQDCVVLFA